MLAKVLRLTGPSQSRERIQTVWCENGSGRLLSGRELEDPSARGVLRAAFATIGPLVNPLVAQPPSHDFTRLGPAEVDATVRIRLEAAMELFAVEYIPQLIEVWRKSLGICLDNAYTTIACSCMSSHILSWVRFIREYPESLSMLDDVVGALSRFGISMDGLQSLNIGYYSPAVGRTLSKDPQIRLLSSSSAVALGYLITTSWKLPKSYATNLLLDSKYPGVRAFYAQVTDFRTRHPDLFSERSRGECHTGDSHVIIILAINRAISGRNFVLNDRQGDLFPYTHCQLRECTATKGLLKSAKCLAVKYCCREHQKSDYKRHKLSCRAPIW